MFVVYLIFILIGGYLLFCYLTDNGSKIYRTTARGHSMSPTVLEGAELLYESNRNPKINDIVVFECFSSKCIEENNGTSLQMFKRLIQLNEQNCWWVEGDNEENSWDSDYFGWLCPQERTLNGIVIRYINPVK